MLDNNTDLASYYFHQGTNFNAYKYLGCTFVYKNPKYVYTFRTWAPSAEAVSVVGDFCGWDVPLYMQRVTEMGVWELIYISEKSLDGAAYKYRIEYGSRTFLKGDPYAKLSRGYDDGASVIYTSKYIWHDSSWLKYRKKRIKDRALDIPINIYEMHFGSFIRNENNEYISYRDMAEHLIPYLKYMNYTHVELLPLTEYPYDASWGYQVCAFFAPTSRFGTPDDFKYFIDSLHCAGIGVIMDWVPAHFPKDEWGLYEFDGKPLYEYQGKDRQESRTWGTRFFDLGREEVQSFLISSAMYFLREFHIDGLRVDAVASMLYLDYDRDATEWIPNQNGGRENLEAIAFFKKLNSAIYNIFPDVLMIAEESGSYIGITAPVEEGGLGFTLKWNMGWANDFYDYISTDPYFRKYKHKALTFPIMYAFNEKYVLPISHDEVVHGKHSFIDKMYGSYEDKFSQMRASLLFMMTFPGKKLLFMGTEYAQFREWDFSSELEWFMLDYPQHNEMREYVAALNTFYLEHSELWEIDFQYTGFEWIYADSAESNLVAYKRINKQGDKLTVIINFSGASQQLTLNKECKNIRAVFDTSNSAIISADETDGSVRLSLSKFSGVILNEKNYSIKIKI